MVVMDLVEEEMVEAEMERRRLATIDS